MSAPSVPANIFTGTLQDILGFANTQVWILADNGYGSQELVLYWIFTNIKEWRQLKYKTPESHSGVSYVDRKIKWLQALAWWVTDLTVQDKIIDLNNFKTDIFAYAIEDSRVHFEDTGYGKGELSNPKYFSHEKWA